MAKFTADEALDYAKQFVKKTRIDATEVKARLLDDAHKMLFMAHPWSWTLGAAGVVTFAASTQDYVTAAADFLRIQWAGRTDNDRMIDLGIAPQLPAHTAYVGPPKKIAHVSTAGANITVRYWPTPTTTDKSLIIYKKTATEITAANSGNPDVTDFPNEFQPLYQELVLYKAWQFWRDPRAGDAQIVKGGGVAYTGQLGVVRALIEEYRSGEPILYSALGTDLSQR
jgi:hypothetical protein